MSASDEEIVAVDEFLRVEKALSRGLPNWTKSTRPKEYEATWPLELADGTILAELRFRVSDYRYPSVSVLYKSFPIWRLDFAHEEICKSNPHDGHKYGLVPEVCGNHEHPWNDGNKEYVRRNGFGKLPYRQVLPLQIRTLDQAFFDLSGRLNIILEPEQRQFNLPPQGELDL